jgi:hypothetical protein
LIVGKEITLQLAAVRSRDALLLLVPVASKCSTEQAVILWQKTLTSSESSSSWHTGGFSSGSWSEEMATLAKKHSPNFSFIFFPYFFNKFLLLFRFLFFASSIGAFL